MKKNLVFLGLFGLLLTSCGQSDEARAKDAVKQFSEAYAASDNEQAFLIYPSIRQADLASISTADIDKLEAVDQDSIWSVTDGSHTFYVKLDADGATIQDSKNVVTPVTTDFADAKLASALGMIADDYTDMELVSALAQLQNGSDFMLFLRNKYPQAQYCGVEVESIKKSTSYGMMDVVAIVKAGNKDMMWPLNADFNFVDADGNVVTTKQGLVSELKANTKEAEEQMVDLDDFPNIKDVKISFSLFNKRMYEKYPEIAIFAMYADISAADYKEFLQSK